MANVISNVVSGKPNVIGGIFRAPRGTALPTDAAVALDAAFVSLGFIGEDGVTETVDRSTEKIKAWGGNTVKVTQSDYAVTVGFTMVEAMSGEALKTAYGDDNVATTAATVSTGTKHAVKLNKNQLEHYTYVLEIKDGDAKIRVVLDDGQVTENGEVTYNDAGIVSYPVTVEAFENEDGDNVVKYLDDGVFAAA